MQDYNFSTGLNSLDKVLKGILPGDNIVWEVDDVKNYKAFIPPYVNAAEKSGMPLVYFRFASHPSLIENNDYIKKHEFDPSEGFESFTDNIHSVIRENGRGAYYVFDCLSELSSTWLSDQMLGNFFRLTCPYLFDLETLAYFCLYRNYHSSDAMLPIKETTQLFLDLYEHKNTIYLRPWKAQHRYSSTMNMFHVWKENSFKLITDSAIVSEILTSAEWSGLQRDATPGFWEREFLRAREAVSENSSEQEKQVCFERLVPMIFSRDSHIFDLAKHYLNLEDIIDIRRRMIGTGLIGGKAVGMLLARAILKRCDRTCSSRIEEHDSFFIGSDVFYDYLVNNGIWWIRKTLKKPDNFLEEATRARRLVITGDFHEDTIQQFKEMIDYFGQSPFIVRSSSLLEDNFGNAFAGKYASVFCANQGPSETRLQDFLAAVRTIYASAMSEKVLRYRDQRGMLESDEQMALLVMRVSGRMYDKNFYPPVAGVGFSFNPYAWDKEIDPDAGVLRLVFGLGTRAVDRSDDDYTRIVALNAPQKRPEQNFKEVRQYTQKKADYINLEANQLVSGYCSDLINSSNGLPLDLLTQKDPSLRRTSAADTAFLSFNNLIDKTDFIKTLRQMLETLNKAYDHPVDIEFTVNFPQEGDYRVNLVQCRPLQVQKQVKVTLPKIKIDENNRIIESKSAVIGRSRLIDIGKFIFIIPEKYGSLTMQERYSVARLIGDINRNMAVPEEEVVMLLGPGRWGTSSPSLGIPVNFNDISKVSVLCEIVAMRENLIPDVSLGTHFLNELVEMEMLYLALFPEKEGNSINRDFFEKSTNHLLDLVPAAEKWKDTVKVIFSSDAVPKDKKVSLIADSLEQRVICFR